MANFIELDNKIRNELQCKTNEYGSVKAVKINNETEYQFLKEWHAAGSSSCLRSIRLEEIKGNYEGPDWYFPKSSNEDMGGWHIYEYWIESLKGIKRDFEVFCKDYE